MYVQYLVVWKNIHNWGGRGGYNGVKWNTIKKCIYYSLGKSRSYIKIWVLIIGWDYRRLLFSPLKSVFFFFEIFYNVNVSLKQKNKI